jgi:hypothetical protein
LRPETTLLRPETTLQTAKFEEKQYVTGRELIELIEQERRYALFDKNMDAFWCLWSRFTSPLDPIAGGKG